jgi:hypothetical protein
MKISIFSVLVCLVLRSAAWALPIHDVGGLRIIEHPDPEKRELLQNIVSHIDPKVGSDPNNYRLPGTRAHFSSMVKD